MQWLSAEADGHWGGEGEGEWVENGSREVCVNNGTVFLNK